MSFGILCITADSQWLSSASFAALRSEYGVEAEQAAERAVERLASRQPDVALVDLSLESIGWLALLRQSEIGQGLPVIAVTASLDDDEAAAALQAGADDYIAKDCAPRELVARVRAVLRRYVEREQRWGSAMKVGAILLDTVRHRCEVRGKTVELRPREFELLDVLMRKSGRVLTRAYLLETVWGMSQFADTRTVDVGVSRLRKALGRQAGRWVETVERYGYRMRNPRDFSR